MMRKCSYRAMLGLSVAVYRTHRDFKTQEKSRSVYNEYDLSHVQPCAGGIGGIGEEYKRCFLRAHVEYLHVQTTGEQ